jgi:hypothetical protein
VGDRRDVRAAGRRTRAGRRRILGTLFFTTLTAAASRPPAALRGYSDAFSSILPWQVGLYVIAAGLMLALPKKAAGHPQ